MARSAELSAVCEAAKQAQRLAQQVVEQRVELNAARKACVAAEAALKKVCIEVEEGEREEDALANQERATRAAAEAVEETRRQHDRALADLKKAATAAARFYPSCCVVRLLPPPRRLCPSCPTAPRRLEWPPARRGASATLRKNGSCLAPAGPAWSSSALEQRASRGC